jgi:hypothetical protein
LTCSEKDVEMKTYINAIAAAAVALAAAAPAFAGSQVVAGNGMTLTEAAQAKFNRDTRGDDRQQIVYPGQSPAEARASSLNAELVAKINAESRGDEQQLVVGSGVTKTTRSSAAGADRGQLISAAGLSPSEAEGMSLSQIAAAKFDRDTDASDR